MAKNKLELNSLTDQELTVELTTAEKHYTSLEFNHNASALANTGELTIARRNVARVQTEIRKRELAKYGEKELASRSKLRARRSKLKKS